MTCNPRLRFQRARTPLARASYALAVTLFTLAGCGQASTQSDAHPSRVLVAVASNFVATLTLLQTEFEATTPYELAVAPGSTGKLYAQIVAGAPYDVFLAADQLRPELLEQQGIAKARFSYAQGQLVVWSAQPHREAVATQLLDRLTQTERRIAVANPALAPYGRAAEQTLAGLGILEKLRPRLVFGENVGQAHALVATGNAELGFTALSYVLASGELPAMVYQLVPETLYEPVLQDAVWLRRAADRPAVAAFVEFLQSPAAKRLIDETGYKVSPRQELIQ